MVTKRTLLLLCFLFPLFVYAQDDSGFYGIVETGMEKYWLNTSDNATKINKEIANLYFEGGYRTLSGWQFGLEIGLAGRSAEYDVSGIPLVRGAEKLPYEQIYGTLLILPTIGVKVGYKVFENTRHTIYTNLHLLADASLMSPRAVGMSFVTPALKFDVEGKTWFSPRWGIGYTLGGTYYPSPNAALYGDDDDFVRLQNLSNDEFVDFNGFWGTYGALKFLYRYDKTNLFIKWSVDAKFFPQSTTITGTAINPQTRQSFGDVSLYIPKHRVLRTGIHFGIEF